MIRAALREDVRLTSVLPVDRYLALAAGEEIICAVKENLERATVDELELGENHIE